MTTTKKNEKVDALVEFLQAYFTNRNHAAAVAALKKVRVAK